jgi:hypothetical protein
MTRPLRRGRGTPSLRARRGFIFSPPALLKTQHTSLRAVLASFQAAAFGLRESLYRAGRSHPLIRAQLRVRLELERIRLSDALLDEAPGRAVAALLSQQLSLLCPTQRVGLCLCLSCGGAVQQICPVRGEHTVPFHTQEARGCSFCARVIGGSSFIHRCLRCLRLRCDACLLDSLLGAGDRRPGGHGGSGHQRPIGGACARRRFLLGRGCRAASCLQARRRRPSAASSFGVARRASASALVYVRYQLCLCYFCEGSSRLHSFQATLP